MTQQAEILHGKRIASQAEQVWKRDSLAGQERLRDRTARFARFAAISAGDKALELGCGTGTWTTELAKLPFDLTSIEISEDLLALARAKAPQRPVQFVQGDAENMLFPDSHFDIVCGVSVLHHLNMPVVLREVRRVLKPGGRSWFSEPNMANPQIAIQKNVPIIKRWSGDTPDETAFFRWPLARQLRDAGFSDIQVTPFDFLHPSLPAFSVPAAQRLSGFLEKVPGLREIAGSLEIHFRRPK